MNWKGRRQSDNVEDRRGISGGTLVGGGLGTLVIALIVMFLGGDPKDVLQQSASRSPAAERPLTQKEIEGREFVSVVLADTEDVWREVFRDQLRKTYREPKLVLFSGQVESACGFADAAVGPFYCPGDGQVYIDLSFYDLMKERFGAAGDFAQAYVIAHEVGHHVQKLMGTSDQVAALRQRSSEAEANRLSVRLELQADFYAGLWAHHAQKMKNILDRGDIEEALNAAAAIGDDTLQKQAQGYIVPESFTHGTSAQRVRWFKKGWDSGRMADGDTFAAGRL